MKNAATRIAIIGAGPVGLEAALTGIERGYDVAVFERGQIAEAVRQWGHVRLFSPFAMNASERGIARLHVRGINLPGPDALLSGAEFLRRYLEPLAQTMRSYIRQDCDVLAVSRERKLKGDHIGEAARAESPFRLLLRECENERVERAHIVLDCSGTFFQPNKLGDGGIPTAGESSCADRIHYGVPNFHNWNDRFAGKRVLVAGAGLSAATAVCALSELKAATPETEILWLIRRDRNKPAEEISNDPLVERASLAARANRLVAEKRVKLIPAATIDAVATQNGHLAVSLGDSIQERPLEIDEIIAATGFRPDLNLTRELQLKTCWATEGTYPLAVSLLGEASKDCLTTPAFGIDMLRHPEPNFFTLGMKSYGRNSNFLLRTGYEQVATVFDWLDQEKELRTR